VYLAEYIRREKLSLRVDTSAFHHNGRHLALKVVYARQWGILTKTTEGQNYHIQIKQINIKCIKSLSFIVCNLLILFSQV
jgi:hypothetical protein